MFRPLIALIGLLLCGGCSAFPDVAHEPRIHNPFPQLERVAVLPFYNQSAEPTLDQDVVAMAYYNELQEIPGFEVVPVGVTKQLMQASNFEPRTGADFQRLAQFMGVDAVVVGSVTEYSPYYPPRIGISVRWYAANPGFHPIPAGYGLPWGTAEEEYIPDDLLFEAEFALAKEQLATQTPSTDAPQQLANYVQPLRPGAAEELPAPADPGLPVDPSDQLAPPSAEGAIVTDMPGGGLPSDWPDPRGFVPQPPSAQPPAMLPQSEPIMSLTRLYHGNDDDFTRRLANYYYFRDEARFGGWQAYLQRSEDFIRFCCHLHITDLLAARGGAGETRVVWRWPIGRYDR